MFGKKECKKCGSKASSKNNFCPVCGNPLNKKQNRGDFGMLGESDEMEFENVYNSMFNGIGGKMIGKMFESAVKMLEKEMSKEAKRNIPNPETNFQLFINGKKINIKGSEKEGKVESKKILPHKVLKKFSQLPRKEPNTNVRRLADRITYEINLPGVKSENDLSIVKLENSIEIKAVSKDKSYQKIIPVNLPVTDYSLSNGKLVLELGSE